MKDDTIELSTTSAPTGYVRATLAIPEHAVRVIAAPPETLTQRNVEAVTGVPARTFLALIRSPGFPLRVRHIGKLRVVNRAAFVEWLESSEPRKDIAEIIGPEVTERSADQPDRANELLASMGLRERAPVRRSRRKR